MGMGAPMSSKARCWRGVGTASLVMRAPPVKTMVLRVRVPSSSRSVGEVVDGLTVVVVLAWMLGEGGW